MRKTPLLRFIPGIQTTSVRNANTASRILVCLLRRDASIMQIAMSNATNPRQDKTYAMMRRRFIAVPFCLALLAPVTAAMITASVRAIPAVMRLGIHVCGELETYSCSAARSVVESVSPGTCGPNVRYMAKCPMEAPNALMMMNCRTRTLAMATIQGRLLKAPPNIHSIMPTPGAEQDGQNRDRPSVARQGDAEHVQIPFFPHPRAVTGLSHSWRFAHEFSLLFVCDTEPSIAGHE